MTPFDVGSDLAGSLRIPAGFCGLFGLKPTENRVPLTGFPPNPQNLPRSVRIMSYLGPMARTVEDLELLFSILAGPDGKDTEVTPVPVEKTPELDLNQLRLAIAPAFPGLPISTENRQAVEELARQLGPLCGKVEEARLPQLNFNQDLGRAGELIGMITGAFQPEEGKAPVTFEYYLQALDWRDQAINAWGEFFAEWDVLICPTAMISPFKHQEQGTPLHFEGRQEEYWAGNSYPTLFNYTGHPAATLPYKLNGEGLPVGVQLVGKRWNDNHLLAVTRSLSEVTSGFQRPPGY